MIDAAYSVIAWTFLLIFFGTTVFWIVEVLVIGRGRNPPGEYGPSEVQARIMTINAEEVVQATVNALPDEISDVRVISERDIDITGATTHIVPEDFTCEARRKARAVEWSRRNIPTDEEFVLYLDEDTIVPSLPPFPDVDIVQLMERPVRTGSWLCYFAEMFRMGFQIEQRTFPRFRYPLYAWGGGFAVKADVENEVTWDTATVTEDTNFIWRAFTDPTRQMAVLPVKLLNQAPPSVIEMIHQRRRWISGASLDSHLLPRRYRVLSLLRNAAWGLVPLSPILLIPLITPVSVVFLPEVYSFGILFQVIGLFAWGFIGYWYCGERFRVLIGLFVTLPVVAIVHALGALWAIVSPATTFRVTQKVPLSEAEDDLIEGLEISVEPDGKQKQQGHTEEVERKIS